MDSCQPRDWLSGTPSSSNWSSNRSTRAALECITAYVNHVLEKAIPGFYSAGLPVNLTLKATLGCFLATPAWYRSTGLSILPEAWQSCRDPLAQLRALDYLYHSLHCQSLMRIANVSLDQRLLHRTDRVIPPRCLSDGSLDDPLSLRLSLSPALVGPANPNLEHLLRLCE